MRRTLLALSLAAGLALAEAPTMAQAPTWSAEQTQVWTVIAQSWSDDVARNGRWPGQYAHGNMVSWGPEWPMPRYRDSIERWTRFSDQQGRVLQYEIAPGAIAIAGDTAVVNYTSVSMRQRTVERGQPAPAAEREAYGITETLVRSGGAWRFLSSTSFPIGGGGDD